VHDWLAALGLPGWIVDELAGSVRCECGARPVAVGVFCQRWGWHNAMWLCRECAELVDEGVTVHWVESARRALDEDRA
jgi:hypothetical protein